MFSKLAKTSSRQREILEVVFRNGWDYMRRLLSGKKADEPELPTPAVLRNILIDLGPVYVKLGQLLSTRPDLMPPAYIEALTDLQANVPPVPWSQIEVAMRQQLQQPLENVFEYVNPDPIAAGSIGQIHRGQTKNGYEVAIKVQRPGIGEVVEQDISIIRGLAELVSRTEFGEYYDPVSLADEFANALRSELDFMQEATYTDTLRRNLSKSRWFDPSRVEIPEVHWELTTEKMLTIEWLEGTPILEADLEGQAPQNGKKPPKNQTGSSKEIANLLLRVFFQQIYLDGFFHADPHPGNVFYLQDGRVALLDCGMAGRLDPRTQKILTELLLAIISLDGQRCAHLTLDLADDNKGTNVARLESDYNRLLRRYYNRNLSEINFSELVYEVLQTARENHVKLPGNIGLYSKTIANLEGVARTLDPEFNLSEQIKPLMSDLLRQQIIGDSPLPALLQTALETKTLSLETPRQLGLLLGGITTETLRWNFSLEGLEGLRRSLDDSANRLSFSIVVGSLIVGAAIIFSEGGSTQIFFASSTLFSAASLLGLWLVISILRSGRLK